MTGAELNDRAVYWARSRAYWLARADEVTGQDALLLTDPARHTEAKADA